MLTHVQSQIMAVGHVRCIKLTTIHKMVQIICQSVLNMHMVHAKQFFASYAFKRSLKSIFSLISAAGDMLTGVQSQIMVAGHVKCI